ncbi:hypothetical protein RND71_027818 [Anisodus tanguticus]|uniref:J domain-containing protein n=1 Tax=Anisodus tanguticus TaxID=243964 RepID=A0AAE1V9F9_9SOLA|nr:hypothetical protein RND71_027818 [Anisodus tanguticus]
MDIEVDHYAVLNLPSGEEGAKLSENGISKAYRKKALELHPDKRPHDPNDHSNFQKLTTSYEILKDEKDRKLFDELLHVKREKIQRQSQQDSKRRKMMSDLDARERAAASREEEEERIPRKLKEEIARIRAKKQTRANEILSSVDKQKVLKVSWKKKMGEDYTSQRLRELFSKFGEVEHVIKSSKNRSALVVMSSKVDADKVYCGDLSDILLVVPLQPFQPPMPPSPYFKPDQGKFENSVLEKMRKAAQRKMLSTLIR